MADEISLRFERDGRGHSNVDMDALRQVFPRPSDDPLAERIGLQALKSLWTLHQQAGASALIIAGLLPSELSLDGYREVIPDADLRVVSLTASAEALRARVQRRELGSDIEWTLDRAERTRSTQRATWQNAIEVDNSLMTVREVAARVLDLVGSLHFANPS